MPMFVIKAFDSNYQEIPYAIEDNDFTVEIPEDTTIVNINHMVPCKKHNFGGPCAYMGSTGLCGFIKPCMILMRPSL
jgi:hypothetical protein